MRKIFLTFALCTLSICAWADDFWEGGNLYVITDEVNHYVKLTVSNSSGEVNFPGAVTHDAVEYTITEIGDGLHNVFSDADRIASITKLVLSDKLSAIAANAFNGCDNLTRIEFYASSMTTGDNAFRGTDAIGWDGIAKQALLYVPEGATGNYKTSSWSIYDIFYENHNIRERSWPEIGTIGYATYYNDHGIILPWNVEAYIVSAAADGNATMVKAYAPYDEVPPATALLLKRADSDWSASTWPEITILTSGSASAPDAPATNFLHGSQTTVSTADVVSGSYYYYKLANDPEQGGLGWYWDQEDGAAFTNGAHKAFLAVPKGGMLGAPKKRFAMSFTDSATGINDVHNEAKSTKVIENGMIYIIRDNVKYSIMGNIVK